MEVAAPPPASLSEAYLLRLKDDWEADGSQRAAVAQLNQLLNILKQSPAKAPRGLYLHGPVGRGKSQLLDMFMDFTGDVPARRTHMHTFMQEAHRRLYAIKKGDPIQQLAREMRDECRILGFDEFYITNIADAILLGRLFEHLFKNGITIVATSNWPMDDLYLNGRNRKSFLPFLRLLKQHLQPIDLGDGQDYRQQDDPEWPVYFIVPSGWRTESDMEALFQRYGGEPAEAPAGIEAKAFSGRCGWYEFSAICERALGRREYQQLTQHVDTLIIEGVPVFSRDDTDAALRFITLIDICYEAHRRVIISAAAYPQDLYREGAVGIAFTRAASRLAEMQTWV